MRGPDHFGEEVARSYDTTVADMFDPAVVEPAVEFLAHLAGAGPVMEFGVGTGRIALPLTRRGVVVHGIDLSPSMLAELRAKPGAEAIEAVIGDFAQPGDTAGTAGTAMGGAFTLVYVVFNTIMNLTMQDSQVACFVNAARYLKPGGCFVVEVMVPDLQRLPAGETFRPFTVTPNRLGFDEYDIAAQGIVSHHYHFSADGVEARSFPFRYVWPSELDLMARIAGLRLTGRWAGWDGEPFTSDSAQHVSVWEKIG